MFGLDILHRQNDGHTPFGKKKCGYVTQLWFILQQTLLFHYTSLIYSNALVFGYIKAVKGYINPTFYKNEALTLASRLLITMF